MGPNMISLQLSKGKHSVFFYYGAFTALFTNCIQAGFMDSMLTVWVISSKALLPVLKATREYVDPRHAAALRMEPEEDSEEG